MGVDDICIKLQDELMNSKLIGHQKSTLLFSQLLNNTDQQKFYFQIYVLYFMANSPDTIHNIFKTLK